MQIKYLQDKKILGLAAIFTGVFISQNAIAGPLGFGVDTRQDLYSIDLGTGNATLIGNTGGGSFLESLAINQSGDLFGADTGGDLYSIDSSNASSTLIGNTGLGNIEALDFLGNTLLGSDFNNTPTIYAIDVVDASTTALITSTTNTGVIRSGTVLDDNTLLIRTDLDGLGNSGSFLHNLDLTTGATSLIGSLNNITAGLDLALDGNLYGLRNNGEVVQIDPSNASETLIGKTGNQFWLGLAASQPSVESVPEPTTGLGLLFFGAMGAGYTLKRKLK